MFVRLLIVTCLFSTILFASSGYRVFTCTDSNNYAAVTVSESMYGEKVVKMNFRNQLFENIEKLQEAQGYPVGFRHYFKSEAGVVLAITHNEVGDLTYSSILLSAEECGRPETTFLECEVSYTGRGL